MKLLLINCPQFKYTTFIYQRHIYIYGCFDFTCASEKLKKNRFFQADSQCKFKRLLKAGSKSDMRNNSKKNKEKERNSVSNLVPGVKGRSKLKLTQIKSTDLSNVG